MTNKIITVALVAAIALMPVVNGCGASNTVKGGAKDGQRAVNGWKNADLPWTHILDKAKMYFPH